MSGAIPVRAYYAQDGDGSSSRSREQLQLSLHCSEVFCVFGLVRQGEDGAHYRQALLLPDMPLSRWRALVRETAVDLFE